MNLKQEISGRVGAKDVLLSTPDKAKQRNNDLNKEGFSMERELRSMNQSYGKAFGKSVEKTNLHESSSKVQSFESLQNENFELRLMELSEDARENLMRLQRFDRVLYPLESERILKKPIEEELKRLEKIKNERKEMRGKLYDNELTITALFNHIKLVLEMNKELEEREILRKDKDEAVRKMHENKRESLKEIKVLKEQLRVYGKGRPSLPNEEEEIEEKTLKKDKIEAINLLALILRKGKYSEGLSEIKKFLRKFKEHDYESCRILEMFVPLLDDQLTVLIQAKTLETKVSEINNVIEKIAREIRTHRFEELERIKVEMMKVESEYWNIGELVEEILSLRKERQVNKDSGKVYEEDIERLSTKIVKIESEYKLAKYELESQKSINEDYLKNNTSLSLKLEKLQAELLQHQNERENNSKEEFNFETLGEELTEEISLRVQLEKELEFTKGEMSTLKKSEIENKRTTIRLKQSETELKLAKDQLVSLKDLNDQTVKTNQNLIIQVQRLTSDLEKNKKLSNEVESYKKIEIEHKKIAISFKTIEEELKETNFELKEKTEQKEGLEKEIVKLRGEIERSRKAEKDQTQLTNRIKQGDDEIRNLREEIFGLKNANSASIKANKLLEKEIEKLKLENQKINIIQNENETLKMSETEQKKSSLRIKQLEEEIQLLREELKKEKASKAGLLKTNESLRLENGKLKSTENENKRELLKIKQSEEEVSILRQELDSLLVSNSETNKQNKVLQRQSDQLKVETEKVKRLTSEIDGLKRIEAELKQMSAKLKSKEEEMKNLKTLYEDEKEKSKEIKSSKEMLTKEMNRIKVEVEMVQKQESEIEKLRLIETEYKRSVIKIKELETENERVNKKLEQSKQHIINLEDSKENEARELFKSNKHIQELNKELNEANKTIHKLQKMEQQLKTTHEELFREKEENAKNSRNIFELEKENQKLQRFEQEIKIFKENHNETKNQENFQILRLQEEAEQYNNEIRSLYSFIEKSSQVLRSNRFSEDFERLKNDASISENLISRKFVSVLDAFSQMNEKNKDLQFEIHRLTSESINDQKLLNQKINKLESGLSLKNELLTTFTEVLKSATRIWLRTKPDQLMTGNKIIDIFTNEGKKMKKFEEADNLTNEFVGCLNSLSGIMIGEVNKLENSMANNLDAKDQEISKIQIQKSELKEELKEKEKSIKEIEKELRVVQGKHEQLTQEICQKKREMEKLLRTVETFSSEKTELSEELASQIKNSNKLAIQLQELQKVYSTFMNEKEQTELKLNEANMEVHRLKKYAQDCVQEEKRVLESLNIEGKEKEKYLKEVEGLHRELDMVLKEKEGFEQKAKVQQERLQELKELETLVENELYQNQVESANLKSSLSVKEKESRTLENNLKRLTQEMKDSEKYVNELEKERVKEKAEFDRISKSLKDHQENFEKQKRDFLRTINKLNEQIKDEIQEKENDRKHYGNIISKLEKNLSDSESHRESEIRSIEKKVEKALKEKEEAISNLEREQNVYREKLREVSRDFSFSCDSGEQEKISLQKQISRLTEELSLIVDKNENQKIELQKQIEKLSANNRHLIQEKEEYSKIYAEDIERAKNEEYQINYEKQKKQREEIRVIQIQLDELHEKLEEKDTKLRKVILECEEVYKSLNLLRSNESSFMIEMDEQRSKIEEQAKIINVYNLKNHELNSHIHSLENDIREFEFEFEKKNRQIESVGDQKDRIHFLENTLNQVQFENIKLKVHAEENVKQLEELREENFKAKASIAVFEKELLASKLNTNVDYYSLLAIRLEEMTKKYEICNENQLSYKIQNQNYERLNKEKDSEIIKIMNEINELKRVSEEGALRIQSLASEKSELEAKIMMNDKNWFIKESHLLKEVEVIQTKLLNVTKYEEEINGLKLLLSESQNETNSSKQETIALHKSLVELKNQLSMEKSSNGYLQKEVEESKSTLRKREQELKEHLIKTNLSLNDVNRVTTVPDASGIVKLLERIGEDRKRENERLQTLLDTANKVYEEKSVQNCVLTMELKHAKMEKEVIEVGWKQKLETVNERMKETQNEFEAFKISNDENKNKVESQNIYFKIQNERLNKVIQDLEEKISKHKSEIDQLSLEVTLKDNQIKIHADRLNLCIKNYEELDRLNKRVQMDLNAYIEESKHHYQELLAKEEEKNNEIDMLKKENSQKIHNLSQEITNLNAIIFTKDQESKELHYQLTKSNNGTSTFFSSQQLQLSSTSFLLEKSNEDLRRENDRLQSQLKLAFEKFESKANEASGLAIELKQLQMEKQINEEQSNYRIGDMMSKITDLQKELNYNKIELKNNIEILKNEKNKSREEKQKLESVLLEEKGRNNSLHEALQKFKIEKAVVSEREKSMRNKLESQEEELRKVRGNESLIVATSVRYKNENQYLREIAQMLDTNYVEDSSSAEGELNILIKISQEISELIDRNNNLEKKIRMSTKSNESVDFLDSIDFMLESIVDYVNSSDLKVKKPPKSLHSTQFEGNSSRYLEHVEKFIKEIIRQIFKSASESINSFEQTFLDVKKFVNLFYKTNDARYLENLKKVLSTEQS